MKDEAFISGIIQYFDKAREKASENFSSLSVVQLNWKPSPDKWSIAQCLEHLLISDSKYFPELEKISHGTYRASTWARISPLSRWFGRMMKKYMAETPKRKMRAPANIRPSASTVGPGIVDNYLLNLETFMKHIQSCREADLDRIILVSPVNAMVTYPLRDTLSFLSTHEHRHLNQALRVMDETGFPL